MVSNVLLEVCEGDLGFLASFLCLLEHPNGLAMALHALQSNEVYSGDSTSSQALTELYRKL